MEKRHRELTIIWKPTFDCNLRCPYCYAKTARESLSYKMSIDNARAAADWLLEYCKFLDIQSVVIIWHGGEPLMMGAAFYQSILPYINNAFEKAHITVENSMQTNLTLWNKSYTPIIKQYIGGYLGFSLDYGSSTRIFPNGDNALPTIEKAMESLQEDGIKYGVICMVTKENLSHAEEMYEYFKKHKVKSFRANRVFQTETGCSRYEISSQEYSDFLQRLWQCMIADPDPLVVTTLSDYARAFLTQRASLCCLSDCSHNFLAITPTGQLFHCGRFYEATDCLGDIAHSSPKEVYEKNISAESGENWATHKEMLGCDSCKWLPICQSGCPYSRKTGYINYDCSGNKLIWTWMEQYFNELGSIEYGDFSWRCIHEAYAGC